MSEAFRFVALVIPFCELSSEVVEVVLTEALHVVFDKVKGLCEDTENTNIIDQGTDKRILMFK